ncbi:MAG TPA: hypothetical protein VMF67_07830 [Rhizomicrobium sp.]|nr:hypothetical protein [Rhizomicrobium sp.]
MHGDDLAVFGIAFSLGVPFVWDAVKERGWRRYVAAAIGALLLIFAISWRWIKADLPIFASAVTTFATDQETWWFLILIGLATFWLTGRAARPIELEPDPDGSLKALGFRDINHLKDWLSEEPLKQIRALDEKIQVFGNPSAATDPSLRPYQSLVWMTPGAALDVFCESRDQWDKAWNHRAELREKTIKTKEVANKLVFAAQYQGIENDRARANVKHAEALTNESEYDKVFESLENDILGELRELLGDGKLIAKGFFVPLAVELSRETNTIGPVAGIIF